MRGSEAARFKGGISAAWDPDRAAKRAAERAISSGLGGETGGGGTGKPCEHPEEAYKDMRYRSYDTVCPVCRGQVPPAMALGGNREIQAHPTHPCKTPDEAYMDARYRKGDTVCPVCNGWLPRKRMADTISGGDAETGEGRDSIRVWGQPERWRKAGKGEVWRKQGLHVGHGRATIAQRAEQEIVPHSETNPAHQYELGCKLEREGDKPTRPLADRNTDLQQAAGWFRAAAFQGHHQALYRLGLCYLQGKGVARDVRQGAAFLRKAAAAEADAAFELGWCYYKGAGVAQDEDQALGWWRIALQMGHLGAQAAIEQSSESSAAKVERGRTALLQYLASLGDMQAQYEVAGRLFEGNTVIKDEERAVHYYEMAAVQGHVAAMAALGLCYYYGRGAKTHEQKAMRWLTASALLGHGIAQVCVCVCVCMYAHGNYTYIVYIKLYTYSLHTYFIYHYIPTVSTCMYSLHLSVTELYSYRFCI